MEVRKAPCCGGEWQAGDTGPIMWNPYNLVVQCHNCGEQYEPVSGSNIRDPRPPTEPPPHGE